MRRHFRGRVPCRFIACNNIIRHNECSVINCPYQHRLHVCTDCRVYMTSAHAYAAHIAGKRHVRRMRMLSAEHKTQGDDGPTPPLLTPNQRLPGEFCNICNMRVYSDGHERTQGHNQKLRFAVYEHAKTESQMDKEGIVVSPPGEVDLGIIDTEEAKAGRGIKHIKVVAAYTGWGSMELLEAKMMGTRAAKGSSSDISKFSFPNPSMTILRDGQRIEIPITFNPSRISGRHTDTLELVFAPCHYPSKCFKITRPFVCLVTDAALYANIAASKPYVRLACPAYPPTSRANEIVPGVKPPAIAKIEWKTRLPTAEVPYKIVERMRQVGGIGKKLMWAKAKMVIPAVFAEATWRKWWEGALWIEEVQMSEDLRAYDIKNTTLQRQGRSPYFLLNVQGLAEKRPSVLVGDSIHVRAAGAVSGKFFEGCVHQLLETNIKVRFHASFQPLDGQKFDIQFTVSRIPLRRMHAALVGKLVQSQTFFPRPPDYPARPLQAEIDAIRLFDRKMEDNPQQKLAIAAILKPRHPQLPFIVFGPPGTGKTSVVVEAVKQLCEDSKSTILLCAPSNSAADLLASRLLSVKAKIFRLCAPSRDPRTIKQDVQHLTLKDASDTFCVPKLSQLLKYKVIICTCISAFVLEGVGVPKGHFSHVFVDEAGQALETEVTIPLKTLQTPETRFILAGDPKQLSPIIRSPVAQRLGLDVSLLERLMSQYTAYSLPKHAGATICKLVQNYRSHPSILQFPNGQFYKNELIACASPIVTYSLLRWNELPNNNVPCIMHNIHGQDMREASSPSFFNPLEVAEVTRYVKSLLEDNRNLCLTQDDIGIITPYQAQVAKIRASFKSNYSSIKVGSVEEFQGQERRVIIMSTVRSNEDHLMFDIKHSLGFVASPKRFNVAITRAQAALVVIGDASVLKKDTVWLKFMNYLYNSGCWKGERPNWDPKCIDDSSTQPSKDTQNAAIASLIRELQSTVLANGDDDGFEASAERGWRREME